MPDLNELKKLINLEVTNLERLVKEMKELLSQSGTKKTSTEIRAAGSILHDFYCGIEKVFERVAVSVDNKNPTGLNWHSELLEQMATPFEKAREKIIPDEFYIKLKEYMRFRHLFRHIYGFDMKWSKFESLALEMETTFNNFKIHILRFTKRL